MRVYLAARYSRHPEMRERAAILEHIGYPVTARWILGDHEIRADGKAETDEYHAQWAAEDWEDLARARIFIAFTEDPKTNAPGRSRGGRHVELGMALALAKRIYVVGHRENVFYWLPQVTHCPDWLSLLLIAEGKGL